MKNVDSGLNEIIVFYFMSVTNTDSFNVLLFGVL